MARLHRVGLILAIPFAFGPRIPHGEPPRVMTPATRTVEFRSYNLKPGARSEFHRLASEVAVPMLRRRMIDVVAYGPSAHDETSYYLVRSFASGDDRRRSEDDFYGSEEWRLGPRQAVLDLIVSYTTVVLELDTATVDGLRRQSRGAR